MRCAIVLIAAFAMSLEAQEPREGKAGDADKLVTIRQIKVEGTRLPALSVIRLAQIKAGDEVNFIKLRAAVQKATQSGLIANVEFEYESLPDKETDVVLYMKCTDVKASARASIQIAGVNEDDLWNWLQQVDPLFAREMPPTEAAIRLYSHWIGKYMESHGAATFADTSAIVADASSSAVGGVTDRLVFKVVKRRGAK